MSTLTSLFGMLPLLLIPGAGTELYRGLASVIVGGLSVPIIRRFFSLRTNAIFLAVALESIILAAIAVVGFNMDGLGMTAFYLAAAGAPVAGIICHNAADLSDPDSVRLTRFPRIGGLLRPVLQPLARIFPELPVPMTAYIDLKLEPVRNMGNARDVLYWDPLLVPFVRLKTLASLGSEPLARPVEEIDIPVMLLQAEMDTIFPTDYIEKIHARLNCEKSLKVYPGLPHYMIVDHVDRILDDVVEWMEHVCGTGTTSKS